MGHFFDTVGLSDDYNTQQEVADRMSISPRTLARMVQNDQFPAPSRRHGTRSKPFWSGDELRRWVRSRRVATG